MRFALQASSSKHSGLGIPVVVTAGTWMAGELGAHAPRGLVMADYSASALYDCLLAARTIMLGGDAAPHVPNQPVLAKHSPANFCDTMLRLMQAQQVAQASP